MRRFLDIVATAAISLACASCGDKQLESTYDKQEGYIEAITESLTNGKEDAVVERNNGSVRITLVHGEGPALEENGAVAFYYAGYYLTGNKLSNSNIFATNDETVASSAKWVLTDSTVFSIATIRLGEDELSEGLKNGLLGVKGGDECYVLFNGKWGFGKKKIANIPSNAALAYHLWIKSVSNN